MSNGGKLLQCYRERAKLDILKLAQLVQQSSGHELEKLIWPWERGLPTRPSTRKELLSIIDILHKHSGIQTLAEANALLSAFGHDPLSMQDALKQFGELLTPPDKMPFKKLEVFVSYSRKDWTEYVEPLVARLNQNNIFSWVDQHLLQGGQDWLDKINEALETCETLVLCVSPDALASKYVKMEYRYFMDENKPIIPVICRETKLPAELRRLQFLKFTDLDKLISQLK